MINMIIEIFFCVNNPHSDVIIFQNFFIAREIIDFSN
jgi:hypothetical protein